MPHLLIDDLSSHQPSNVEWLWPGRVPRGKVTLLCGDPGLGKSFITLDMAARVTRGGEQAGNWPDAKAVIDDPGSVLLLSAEDDPGDTIRPRIDAAGGDPSRIHIIHGVRRGTIGGRGGSDKNGKPGANSKEDDSCDLLDLERDVARIEQHVRTMDRCRLIVIDPISAYLGQTDSHNNAQVRSLLARLAGVAQRCGPAVVCVTHLSKSSNTQASKAVYRAMGSLAFTAAARMVWLVGALPDEPDKRAMTLVKTNLAANTSSLIFRVDDGRVNWLETNADLTADALEDREQADAQSATAEAAEFLKSLLEAGPMAASEVIKRGEEAGISLASIKRAKGRAGVRATRSDGSDPRRPWVWALNRAA